MKIKNLLVAALMFVGLSAAAFAQATFTVGSVPVTTVTSSGQTENTGNITFNTVSGSPFSVTGTLTINYGVPITAGVTGTPFPIAIVPGTFLPTPTINSINNAAGQLVLNVSPGGTGSFSVTGVKVAIAGTSLTSVSANISSTGNAIVAGQTTVVVISSVTAGIASFTETPAVINAVSGSITTGGPAAATTITTLTLGTPNAATFTPSGAIMRVREGFLGAFGVAADPTNTTAVVVRITLSAAPPAGVTVTFPATAPAYDTASPAVVTGGNFTTSDSVGGPAAGAVSFTSTSTSLAVYYKVTSSTDNTKIEDLTIPLTITVASSTTLPLPAAIITATATLAPIGTAFSSTGAVLTTPIPRFAAVEVGPVTVVSIAAANTNLIIPYAVRQSAISYDTGIAIANTTTDPGTTAMGVITAVKQAGTIVFNFYPQTGTPFSYTTSATSPGSGLTATGTVATGGTYVVLLSQLLAAAAAPADFQGYIVMTANFTNGHGQYFVSNFTNFSNGSLMLVIGGPRTTTPEGLGQ